MKTTSFSVLTSNGKGDLSLSPGGPNGQPVRSLVDLPSGPPLLASHCVLREVVSKLQQELSSGAVLDKRTQLVSLGVHTYTPGQDISYRFSGYRYVYVVVS